MEKLIFDLCVKAQKGQQQPKASGRVGQCCFRPAAALTNSKRTSDRTEQDNVQPVCRPFLNHLQHISFQPFQ